MNLRKNLYIWGKEALDKGYSDMQHWYTDTFSRVSKSDAFLRSYGVPMVSHMGALAALSPNTKWEELEDAYLKAFRGSSCLQDAIEALPRLAYPANRAKAASILLKEGPIEDYAKGAKVGAFFRALTGDRSSVTLDMWAARAAYDDPAALIPTRVGEHKAMVKAYRDAAKDLGMYPRETQAMVWGYYRMRAGGVS